MIIDTDVLIWHLRGNEKAKEFIHNSFPFNISVVTYIEIIQGMRDKKEMHRLLKQFAQWRVNIVQIKRTIKLTGGNEAHLSCHPVERLV